MWYIMTSPVTVSIDLPQPRDEVFAFLDVMANHESFTDHMLVDWKVSGPATGIGSKAHVTAKVGGITDQADIEVIEVDPGRRIKERNIAAKGKRHRDRHVRPQRPPGRWHARRVHVRVRASARLRAAAAAADAQDAPARQPARDGAAGGAAQIASAAADTLINPKPVARSRPGPAGWLNRGWLRPTRTSTAVLDSA